LAKTLINSDLIQRYQNWSFFKWNIYGGKFVFYEVQYTIALLFIQDGRAWKQLCENCIWWVITIDLNVLSLQTLFAPILCMFSYSKNVEFGSQYLYRLARWKHIEAPKKVITNKFFFNYFWIEYGHYILDFFLNIYLISFRLNLVKFFFNWKNWTYGIYLWQNNITKFENLHIYFKIRVVGESFGQNFYG